MYHLKNLILKKHIMGIEPIENSLGGLDGIILKFKPLNPDTIYYTSNKEIIQFFPHELSKRGIILDFQTAIKLQSLLLHTISTYLYSLRKNLDKGELVVTLKSKLDNERYIRIRLDRRFIREENKGRYKIYMSIIKIDKEFDLGEYEEILFDFTKRDALFLYGMIRKIISRYERTKTIFLDAIKVKRPPAEIRESLNKEELEREFLKNKENEISEGFIPITKADNSILINRTWLHGQEVLNIMFLMYKIIYGFKIEEHLESTHFFYRQISTVTENGIVYLIIRKMNEDHLEEPMVDIETEEEYYLKIPINALFLATIDSLMSIQMLQNIDMSIADSSGYEIINSQNPFINTDINSLKKIKIAYHVSLRESWLGVSLQENKNNPDEKELYFVGLLKDDVYKITEDDGNIIENAYIKNGEIHTNIMKHFKIKLGNKWPKIIKGLAIALTKEYINPEKPANKNVKYTITSIYDNTHEGRIRYDIIIYSAQTNKAPAVLLIQKYKLTKINNGEYDEELLETFRQPLFERYVFMLLHIFLGAGELMNDIELLEEVTSTDMIKIQYKSIKNITLNTKPERLGYGIKKEDGKTYWGAFKLIKEKEEKDKRTGNIKNIKIYENIKQSTKKAKELTFQEQCYLNESAYSRLTRKYWLPFVGDVISVGPDRFITDLYAEINMKKIGKSQSFQEIDWAIRLFFGSIC